MNANNSNSILPLFLFVVLLGISFCALGQTVMQEDPKGNAVLWAKLKQAPHNDALWAAYFGKDLFDLSAEEQKIFEWWQAKLDEKNAEIRQKTALALEKKRAAYYNRRNETTEKSQYERLLSNIAQNFALIEAYFQTYLKEYNIDYKPYHEVHPDGKYNKLRWVHEWDDKIKEMESTLF